MAAKRKIRAKVKGLPSGKMVVVAGGNLPEKVRREVRASWSGLGWSSQAPNVSYFPPVWFSPIISYLNWFLPFDRATAYQWIRYWDTFHPLVGNVIDLHTQMPLSRFGLKGIKDKKVLQFYEDMLDEMNAFRIMYSQLREYNLLGEAFTYLLWDDNLAAWIGGEQLMPEYIDVLGHPLAIAGDEERYVYELIVDESLIEFINDPRTEDLVGNLPDEIRDAVDSDKNIRIDPFSLMVMMNTQSGYHPRGTSLIFRVMKDLIYEMKLQEAQHAIAERHVSPKELWFLGSDKFPVGQDQIDEFTELVQNTYNQPLFNLVTHHAVNYQIVGAAGKFPNLSSEFDWVKQRVLVGLFSNEAMATGQGPNYATASVAARVAMMRYIPVRDMLEDMWEKKVFLPVAIAHNFRETTEAELEHGIRVERPLEDRPYMIPKFDWRHKASLLDDASHKELLFRFVSQLKAPVKLLTDALGIDYDYFKRLKEQEEGTVADSFYEEWRKGLEKETSMRVAATAPVPQDLLFEKSVKEGREVKDGELVFIARGGTGRTIRLMGAMYREFKKRHGREPEDAGEMMKEFARIGKPADEREIIQLIEEKKRGKKR